MRRRNNTIGGVLFLASLLDSQVGKALLRIAAYCRISLYSLHSRINCVQYFYVYGRRMK